MQVRSRVRRRRRRRRRRRSGFIGTSHAMSSSPVPHWTKLAIGGVDTACSVIELCVRRISERGTSRGMKEERREANGIKLTCMSSVASLEFRVVSCEL